MQATHATIEVQEQGKIQNVQNPIVVTGEREYNFSPYHWRQAVRQYLACIWTNHCSAQETVDLTIPTYAPSIGTPWSHVHLRYLAVSKRYQAFGSYDETYPPALQDVRRGSVLRVTVNQPEQIEVVLSRFAWNRQMRVLGIRFPDGPYMKGLWLWSYPGGLKVFEEPRDGWVLGR